MEKTQRFTERLRRIVRVITRPDAWGEPNPEHQALRGKVFSDAATEAERQRFQELHWQRSQAILERPLETLFNVTMVETEVPAKARIHNSVTCADCGESVMETRSRLFRGETLCIPCFETRDRRFAT